VGRLFTKENREDPNRSNDRKSEKEVMKPKQLNNQSTAIGKRGTEVTLYCYDESDADEVFEWLTNIGDESKLQFVGEISPEEVMRRLGCEPDKKYKFTISCEEA